MFAAGIGILLIFAVVFTTGYKMKNAMKI